MRVRAAQGFETIGSKLWGALTLSGLRNKSKTKQFDRLSGATGAIRPGTLTLLQAPPGHGKSTLLKTLAAREQPTAGALRYNGLTQAEALEAGVHVSKLVQYVDQVCTRGSRSVECLHSVLSGV